MDTIQTDPNAANSTTNEQPPEVVNYENEAKQIATVLATCIVKHQTPAESGAVPAIQGILGTNPQLLMGLMGGNLFDTGESAEEKAARTQKLAEIDAAREALRKQMESLNDERKSYTLDESPKQEAVREILQAGMNSFLNQGSYVSTRIAAQYEALGLEKPEPLVKRGAKQKTDVPASENGVAKNDLTHVSRHAEGNHE